MFCAITAFIKKPNSYKLILYTILLFVMIFRHLIILFRLPYKRSGLNTV